MTTWPTSPGFVTTNVDAGTDNPASARSDIKDAMDDLIDVIGARGVANGVASLTSSGLVPHAQLPFTRIATFTSPGGTSWTIPANVTAALIIAVGGGGGGGFTSAGTGGDHGGGGGGGGVAIRWYTGLTPAGSITINVGAAGQGGAVGVPDANGTSGGNSTASDGVTTITGAGGGGGVGGGTRYGGGGGAGFNGHINLQGGAAASGEARGGMGGSSPLCGAIAGAAAAYGGGGFGSGDPAPGFDGATGGVIILY